MELKDKYLLTEEQKKAIKSLTRAAKKCEKLGILLLANLCEMYAINKNTFEDLNFSTNNGTDDLRSDLGNACINAFEVASSGTDNPIQLKKEAYKNK